MRVFVTVGNAHQPFDRILHLVDQAIAAHGTSVDGVCQHGASSFRPRGLTSVQWLDRDDFNRELDAADIVVTHAGIGTLGLALSMGHKPIVVPRRGSLGEHVNDHQLEIVRELTEAGSILDGEGGFSLTASPRQVRPNLAAGIGSVGEELRRLARERAAAPKHDESVFLRLVALVAARFVHVTPYPKRTPPRH